MQETILVTGATRGLGRALTEALVKRGTRVIATGRSAPELENLTQSLRTERGEVVPIAMDVSEDQSVFEAAQKVADITGHLDGLVNNAGVILESGQSFVDLSPDTLAATLSTNAIGAFRTTQAFRELLSNSANPRIVNVSSGMGVMEGMGPGTTAYRASKAAMNVISLQAHFALRPQGIRVMSICPGWVRTDMGGPSAARDLTEGIAGILWAIDTDADGPSGKFFRDGREISW